MERRNFQNDQLRPKLQKMASFDQNWLLVVTKTILWDNKIINPKRYRRIQTTVSDWLTIEEAEDLEWTRITLNEDF